jgi:hypothetical protein
LADCALGSIRSARHGLEYCFYLEMKNPATLENSLRLAYVQDIRRHEVLQNRRKPTSPAGFRGGGALPVWIARDGAKSGSDVDVFVDPGSRPRLWIPVEIGYSTRTGIVRSAKRLVKCVGQKSDPGGPAGSLLAHNL